MKVTKPLLLGIDAGSRALRAALFSLDGELVSMATGEYGIRQPQPGWAEQDPTDVWQALVCAVTDCLEQAGAQSATSVVGMSLTGTTVTLVMCDHDGRPLAPAILWMDTRATPEAARLLAMGSEWFRYSGGLLSPEWMLPKALWLKRNQPDVYANAYRIVELTDWLNYRLTRRWTGSLNIVSAEWSYASPLGGWPYELFEKVELDDLPGRLPPEIIAPGVQIGTLSAIVANELGLPEDTPVAQGMMDSYAAALGLNVFTAGRVAFSLGTSSAFLILMNSPRSGAGLRGPIPDVYGPGTWALQGGQTSAGAVVRWFVDQLGQGSGYAELDAGAAAIPPGAEGLIALDCWQGSRSPYLDPQARGAIWGLGLGHSRHHIYRALLEAVAFGGRQILDTMASAGLEVRELWACGGGTRSDLWMRIHADVMGIPLVIAPYPDMSVVGAAICAAVASGFYPDLPEAAHAMTKRGRLIEPDPDTHSRYDDFYEEYRWGYPALRESLHRLVGLTEP